MSESKLIREALKQIFEANSQAGISKKPEELETRGRFQKTKEFFGIDTENDFNDRNAARTSRNLARLGPLAGSGPVSAGATSLDRDDIALRTTEMENKRKMDAQAERGAEAAGPGRMGSVSVSPNNRVEPDKAKTRSFGANAETSPGAGRGIGPQGPMTQLQRLEAEISHRRGTPEAVASRAKGKEEAEAQVANQTDIGAKNLAIAAAGKTAEQEMIDAARGRTPDKKEPFKMPQRPITPTPVRPATAAEPEAPKSYTVQKGENLWNIIKQRNKTANKTMSNTDIANEVKRLAQLNKMKDPNKIMPGQEIKFEEKEMTISKSLIDAFNGVISSKHPNVFQEAKKNSTPKTPKTAKEKELAALAEPKDKITHKDVLVGRGVFDEEIVKASRGGFSIIRSQPSHEGHLLGAEPMGPGEADAYHAALPVGDNKYKITPLLHPETGEELKPHQYKKVNLGDAFKYTVNNKMKNEEIESIFSEAELAYFEGVGKIAGKPDDKSVPAGKDTSNATGSRSGTLSDEYVEEGRRGRPPKGESLGANELHMNAKRAADNMDNVTHTFANGQKVKMTKAMGVGFLSRHRAAKTADDKDDVLNHAHSSLSAFKDVVEGKPIPEKKKKGISLAGNM